MDKHTGTAAQDSAPGLAPAGLAEAHEALGRFIEAARQANELMSQSGDVMASGTREFYTKAVQHADKHMRLGFELAERLLEAKEIGEVLEIQTEFMGDTVDTYVRQAMELSNLIESYIQKR